MLVNFKSIETFWQFVPCWSCSLWAGGWCSNRTFVKQNISDQTLPTESINIKPFGTLSLKKWIYFHGKCFQESVFGSKQKTSEISGLQRLFWHCQESGGVCVTLLIMLIRVFRLISRIIFVLKILVFHHYVWWYPLHAISSFNHRSDV